MGLAHVGKERSWNGRGHDGSSRVRLARADRAPVALGDGGVFFGSKCTGSRSIRTGNRLWVKHSTIKTTGRRSSGTFVCWMISL